MRGVHAKSHGRVRAQFRNDDNIDERYRVGLFTQPGKVYPTWIRFSNAAALRDDDLQGNGEGVRHNGSRAMAIEVINVDGERLDDARRSRIS